MMTRASRSRRDFLRDAGLAAGGALVLSAAGPWPGWIERAIAAAAEQAVSGGRVAVVIGGQHAGYLVLPPPAQTTRTPVTTPMPAALKSATAQQMLARRGPSMTLEFGSDMSKPWFEWIAQRINASVEPRDGALVFLDDARRVQSRKQFTRASIVELTLPWLSAASKEAATASAKLMVMSSSTQGGDQSVYASKPAAGKPWMRANFLVTIDGLPTTRVKNVEAMTFRFPGPGSAPAPATSSGTGVTLPVFRITVDARDLDPFAAWYKNFVIDGKSDASKLKSGQLRWLTNDHTAELGTLSFQGLGPIELKRLDAAASEDKMSDFQFSMYVGRVQASFAGMA